MGERITNKKIVPIEGGGTVTTYTITRKLNGCSDCHSTRFRTADGTSFCLKDHSDTIIKGLKEPVVNIETPLRENGVKKEQVSECDHPDKYDEVAYA